ncbi:DUF115 domain-containing protein [Oscillochloris sp. ZM17-4]|uniref:6-hydroxymethylpterin diphosphokinase MptE-like protein n=1 Tax=Oscillochloris sp. ZM17-4 TaxID=2866714 RepID=UPI001C72A03F|nr:6-hydroxymethylpterin diphosphokinase MptE-like protein [Oscillochloris sp. ZM17-4]MBX0331027.1 DUF115 domain-containing protein [Oscillochloris sp. ZM17-4]
MTPRNRMPQGEPPPPAGHATINPYRSAAYELWSRLRWDVRPESWRSRRALRAWRDRHPGQKAVILCNGPSLLKADLALLDGVFTFGLNKINLLFPTSPMRPSCIVAVNPLVIEQNAAFYRQTSIPLFLDSCALRHVRPRPNITYLHSSSQHKFARDCAISIFQGATVTFVAMQLAFHMGFRQVALVGCDHSFSAKGPANMTVVSGERDSDHFDPNYFAGGVRWQLPDMARSEFSYAMAREAFAESGGRIVNCTVGGRLEIYPRMDLAAFLRS